MSTNSLVPAGTRFGNYEVTEFLGEGGMGTVYRAVHLGLGKKVALKTLRADLAADGDVRARFLREGKAAAAVRHPNVVDVDDVGVQGDTPYLVMELLEGEDLGALVERSGHLGVQQTVDIMIPVLLAMAAAHRAGVVHRDLKPDNIFLAHGHAGVVVPKVLDFGISKLRETHSLGLTGNNAMLGTPYYMSPEQAGSARDVDARSDLFSIGVILYHCVTGHVPFAGSSLAQVIGQILHAQPAPLREAIADVPPAYEQVVLGVMAKDPAARPADATVLAQQLLPFASVRVQLTCGPELLSGATLPSPASPHVAAGTSPRPAIESTLSPHSVTTERTPTTGWRVSLLLTTLVAIALAWYFRAVFAPESAVPARVEPIAPPLAAESVVPFVAPASTPRAATASRGLVSPPPSAATSPVHETAVTPDPRLAVPAQPGGSAQQSATPTAVGSPLQETGAKQRSAADRRAARSGKRGKAHKSAAPQSADDVWTERK